MDVDVLIPLGLFTWFGFTAWVIVEGFRRRQQLKVQAEFQCKLLDRMGSAQELNALFNSEGGTKLLASFESPRRGWAVHARILRALQSGLVLLSLGIGLFLLLGNRSAWIDTEAKDGLALFGTIATALGVGLLLSATGAYALSRHMGLLSPNDEQRST